MKNGRIGGTDNRTSVELIGKGMKPVLVYLPIRANVTQVEIGLKPGSKIEPWKHPSGITKPVVHYGTSIVHGGCASRPGLIFSSQAGRLADVPYVNLGFSGSARLESEMATVMARADASLYIVDTVWNCSPNMINERTEVFLRKLHSARPDAPILLCEGGEPYGERLKSNIALEKVWQKLKAEGALEGKLHYLSADGMISADGESTHDYCHPNDWGSMQMGMFFARKIKELVR